MEAIDYLKSEDCPNIKKAMGLSELQLYVIAGIMQAYHKKQCAINGVIHWVAVKEQLPPINKKVWLYNTENDNYEAEFVNKLDLTTKRYERNWTHWAEVKPPYRPKAGGNA